MAEQIHPRVRQVRQQDRGILDAFGMTVTRALDGVCEAQCEVPASLVNAAGFGHGSIAFSLMDTACAYAIGSTEHRGVTVNANVTYVRGLTGGARANSRVEIVSRSRRVATLTGQVWVATADGDQELAAHGTFVFQIIEVRE